MPPEEISKRLEAIELKVNAIYESTEKTRKYFLVTLVLSAALVILPAVGLLFAIPSFMSGYSTQLNGLDSFDLEGL